MLSDMSSKKTLYILAVAWGVASGLSEFARGATPTDAILHFIGSMVLGTLITLGIVWVVLAIIGKRHLLYTVTNWMLLISVGLTAVLGIAFGI